MSPSATAPITIATLSTVPTTLPLFVSALDGMGFSSLSKKREPQPESEERHQARIAQNWKRDRNMKAQQQLSSGRREHQA
jgi:hypothetical protein